MMLIAEMSIIICLSILCFILTLILIDEISIIIFSSKMAPMANDSVGHNYVLFAEMSSIFCLSIQCFNLAMMLIAEMSIIICLSI